MIFCDDIVQLPYGLRIAEIDRSTLGVNMGRGFALHPKKRANFAVEVDMSRRYGCHGYGFTIGGLAAALRNRTICSYDNRTAAAIVM